MELDAEWDVRVHGRMRGRGHDQVRVCVVGLGAIGLPLAVQCASKGCSVAGVDVDSDLVARLNVGNAEDATEPLLQRQLLLAVEAGLFGASTEFHDAVAGSDVVLVVVPVRLTGANTPDLEALLGAAVAIGKAMRPGTLVCCESTVPVGTTNGRLRDYLETSSGLLAGRDFHLAFSPERVSVGSVFADLKRYPKLVGGVSESCATRAVEFYEHVLDFDPRPDLDRTNGVWDLGSPEAAELAKLAETTYRDVNIALANEFAMFSGLTGIDFEIVRAACNSQPYSHLHRAGVAVGGHCIPVYPHLYMSQDPNARLANVARAVNRSMPAYAVRLLARMHGSLHGARVAILGLSYRGGVKEAAGSGAFDLCSELIMRGADVRLHDPMFSAEEVRSLGFTPFALGEVVDAAIVHTDHQEYARLRKGDLLNVKSVVDGRGVLNSEEWSHVRLSTIGGRTPRPA